jgi:hypothetical protein
LRNRGFVVQTLRNRSDFDFGRSGTANHGALGNSGVLPMLMNNRHRHCYQYDLTDPMAIGNSLRLTFDDYAYSRLDSRVMPA